MNNRKQNFFLVIGAQKSGTTSLFNYMKRHPDIHLDNEKESDFFLSADISYEKWQEYYKNKLQSKKKIIGIVSTHYSISPLIAKNVYKILPKAKIIYILRDPIERAISHYKMLVRRGHEKRSFEDIVNLQLNPIFIKKIRSKKNIDRFEWNDDSQRYIAKGEYDTIIKSYQKLFNKNLICISSEEMLFNTQNTVNKIYNFLNVRNIENVKYKIYHSSKFEEPGFVQQLYKIKILRLALKSIFPNKILHFFMWKYFFFRSKKSAELSISRNVFLKLKKHFVKNIKTVPSDIKDNWFLEGKIYK